MRPASCRGVPVSPGCHAASIRGTSAGVHLLHGGILGPSPETGQSIEVPSGTVGFGAAYAAAYNFGGFLPGLRSPSPA